MSRLTILDPTAAPPNGHTDPGPPLEIRHLEAHHVGLRYDRSWKSFDWVRDEWAQCFEASGSRIEAFCAGDRTGEAAEETRASLVKFLAEREVLISGLGN